MSLAASKPLRDFLTPLRATDPQLYDVACSFSNVFRELASSSEDDSLFSPVPVTHLPSGRECGRFLAVDVGITTLKVAFIDLLGETAMRSRSMSNMIRKARHSRVRRTLEKAWRIEERLKHDQPHELFLWIGNCIAEVVKDDLLSNASSEHPPSHIETGIAFSLPIKQDSLEEATLMQTGKGFTISSDLDLRNSILQGYERHTQRRDDEERAAKRQRHFVLPQLKITALTNDAVATLLSLSYSIKSYPNSRVAMGIVLDEGCNATIPMILSDLHPSKTRHITAQDPDAAQTLVSTEWTLRGAASPLYDHGIITKWDLQLDSQSAKPGFQPLEYMTGGRYIGELIRIICHDYFTSILGISDRSLPTNLVVPYALRADFIIDIMSNYPSTTTLSECLNRNLPPPSSSGWTWTAKTANVLREIVQAVQTRSAALVAAATVALLASNHEVSLRDPATPLKNELLSCSPSKSFHEITFGSRPDWHGGPEELVVACIGGVIQHYPKFIENCQRYIDRLVIQGGPQDGGKSVFLREANDGVIIGAGVLAGMVGRD
ncbi:putative hexokinase [Talaromyces proteolyticus]|uniref:Phosphotransferase n=1 Tax=Talaromyces proteolyticus TaxID=1131652 RepID=A0AAD4KE73_9EURO|nr:putative hexokinase [Talaromyces proteolyticus]KAH8689868.1 putative hexokinase [Talaromyces proteolyticus]